MVSVEMLREFQLFEGLKEGELKEIVPLCQERSYEDGSVVFTAGGSAEDVYMLRTGRVSILLELVIYDLEARADVYTIEEGETFGWSALVPPHKLTATARCQRPCDVVTINGRQLLDLLNNNRDIGFVVMRNLCRVISARLGATMIALRHHVQQAAGGARP
jgi:CRP-like cAMP-binding protein